MEIQIVVKAHPSHCQVLCLQLQWTSEIKHNIGSDNRMEIKHCLSVRNWLCHSGRSWRWRRSSDVRSSARWRSTSLPSRVLYGRCMYWSTGRPKRSTLACLSGRSGPNLSLSRSVSPVASCSCMFSAKCTSSCVAGGVPTTASSMSRIARVIHHVGQAVVEEKPPALKGCGQTCPQSVTVCHVWPTLSQPNYSCYNCHWLCPVSTSTE